MVDFRQIIDNLQDWHFYDVILPFLLVYVIIYAVLEKSQIFKVKSDDAADNKHVRNVNAVIAFVFGLFTVASIQTVHYIQNFIVSMVLFVIFILVMLILLGFIFGSEYLQLFMRKEGDSYTIRPWAAWGIGIVVFVIALIALSWATGFGEWIVDWWDDVFYSYDDSETLTTVLVLAILGGILYWITKGSSNSSSGSHNE